MTPMPASPARTLRPPLRELRAAGDGRSGEPVLAPKSVASKKGAARAVPNHHATISRLGSVRASKRASAMASAPKGTSPKPPHPARPHRMALTERGRPALVDASACTSGRSGGRSKRATR